MFIFVSVDKIVKDEFLSSLTLSITTVTNNNPKFVYFLVTHSGKSKIYD